MPNSNNRNNNRTSVRPISWQDYAVQNTMGTVSVENESSSLTVDNVQRSSQTIVSGSVNTSTRPLPYHLRHIYDELVTEIDVAPNELVSPLPSPSIQRQIDRLVNLSIDSWGNDALIRHTVTDTRMKPSFLKKDTDYGTIVIKGKIANEITTRRNRERVKPEKSLFGKSGGGVGAGKLKGITR